MKEKFQKIVNSKKKKKEEKKTPHLLDKHEVRSAKFEKIIPISPFALRRASVGHSRHFPSKEGKRKRGGGQEISNFYRACAFDVIPAKAGIQKMDYSPRFPLSQE
ncbi:MAG: hypothetical protein A3G52_04325 [Candidatus Taylorbacteria bacterium RIFCSPLOWO2_12_FULL_43_20]|uniref:Uncharacterized protein n=1 Tax=Candidatus Taylorbacteria bacterium RIFCSPLOWO2_12_FULL_43_20 TaxID=1802332 RepID=A0A1G2NZZ5_9BACT|nr:MAG: hypothetical protein A2825_01450 [Candidatus Taylorbacteria bacterium RIFCSPHIGHO2_01_FULL_43_120]OHA23843.1 MAG: hypothetical protein A3B98_04555 [Candidatus Taylorbacteria bacterium RIFCSPHIGHO2_02_FULL_43_55]OHA30262.1 MAG: hypothetical protein A3E92_04275 [Candidatus Taylorbacteria bacterium RIFCSPHIGHO2_12_FULL_42_34]OHA30475.1 MAG: hypothetical protein A3B09_03450 [Candidatus Taylorbacteria bacterium RIFCSPLOWO2_01_FULL_43_83]OHA38663.1 MAG: hypothetical protein A3H58_03465 [Candi